MQRVQRHPIPPEESARPFVEGCIRTGLGYVAGVPVAVVGAIIGVTDKFPAAHVVGATLAIAGVLGPPVVAAAVGVIGKKTRMVRYQRQLARSEADADIRSPLRGSISYLSAELVGMKPVRQLMTLRLTSALDAQLRKLPSDERRAQLLAILLDEGLIGLPQPLLEALVHDGELENLRADIAVTALRRLATINTPRAFAEIALHFNDSLSVRDTLMPTGDAANVADVALELFRQAPLQLQQRALRLAREDIDFRPVGPMCAEDARMLQRCARLREVFRKFERGAATPYL